MLSFFYGLNVVGVCGLLLVIGVDGLVGCLWRYCSPQVIVMFWLMWTIWFVAIGTMLVIVFSFAFGMVGLVVLIGLLLVFRWVMEFEE